MNGLIVAAMVLTNLLYVLGAVVAATLVSALLYLRHRRPKSLEAGIEMFSKELKALEPERGAPVTKDQRRVITTPGGGDPRLRPVAPSEITPARRRPSAPSGLVAAGAAHPAPGEVSGRNESRNEAEAPSPDWEDGPG